MSYVNVVGMNNYAREDEVTLVVRKSSSQKTYGANVRLSSLLTSNIDLVGKLTRVMKSYTGDSEHVCIRRDDLVVHMRDLMVSKVIHSCKLGYMHKLEKQYMNIIDILYPGLSSPMHLNHNNRSVIPPWETIG